jgi:hypothetical protein
VDWGSRGGLGRPAVGLDEEVERQGDDVGGEDEEEQPRDDAAEPVAVVVAMRAARHLHRGEDSSPSRSRRSRENSAIWWQSGSRSHCRVQVAAGKVEGRVRLPCSDQRSGCGGGVLSTAAICNSSLCPSRSRSSPRGRPPESSRVGSVARNRDLHPHLFAAVAARCAWPTSESGRGACRPSLPPKTSEIDDSTQ